MNTHYIYIDESGDLGLSKNSSKFLIISALLTQNPEKVERIIKNARRNKFQKELKKAQEIKFNKSGPELIKYLISKMNETTECRGFHCVMEKKKLFSEFLMKDKNKMYNYVVGRLAKEIKLESGDVEVRVDKSKTKKLLRDDFNLYFERNLRDGSQVGKINIFHSNSENFSGIQLADILAGCYYQKYNNRNSEYVELIDSLKFPQNIIDTWENKI